MQQLAPSPSQQDRPSYGLVSLWEMYEFNAATWLQISSLVQTIEHVMRLQKDGHVESPVDDSDLWRNIGRDCGSIKLLVSQQQANDISEKLKTKEKVLAADYRVDVKSFVKALHAEVRSHLFMRVDYEYSKYFKGESFGLDVRDKFPSAIRDIEDGGKCLACGQGTACVFHMMRVMEVGLRSLARSLGIPYAPSWESYLSQIEKKISAKHKSKNVKWKRDEPYFRDILGDLQNVKIAWRNPTMHIVRHYTQDEAEDVFRMVRTFMTRLAPRHGDSSTKKP